MAQEIILNHITANEFGRFPETYEQYIEAVTFMMGVKDMFLFEDDIVKEFIEKKENVTSMEDILTTFPNKFVPAGNRFRVQGDQQPKRTWFDVWANYIITPANFSYDVFFAYQLRNLDLLAIDEFLNFQVQKYFENDIPKFKRFLFITLRKHDKLLQPEQKETVVEWMALIESYKEFITEEEKAKINKSKITREAGDNLTRLNKEQTVLLIHFLKITRVFLKDEYLNNKQAGLAFYILTGYSADTIRQGLGKIKEAGMSKQDIVELHNLFVHLTNLTQNTLNPKK